MHVIFRESHGLEETAQPVDLQQTPADMVVLSFSDSDLGAFSVGWHNAKEDLPSLRLANLAALQHPLSVDTYIEQTLRDVVAEWFWVWQMFDFPIKTGHFNGFDRSASLFKLTSDEHQTGFTCPTVPACDIDEEILRC